MCHLFSIKHKHSCFSPITPTENSLLEIGETLLVIFNREITNSEKNVAN